MLRKWIALMMSLLMLLMLPFGAMADTQHTLSVVPGEELVLDQAIKDLLDVLSLRLTTGETSGALTVLLNDNEITTLGTKADADGLYAASDILGSDVLFATWSDLFDLIYATAQANLDAGDEESAVLLETLQTSLDEAEKAIVDAFNGDGIYMAEITGTSALDFDLEAAAALYGDDAKLMEYIENINNSTVTEYGTFTAEGRDDATQKDVFTMTKDDLCLLLESQYIVNSTRETMAAQLPEATEAELDEAVAEVIAEVKRMFGEGEYTTTVTVYSLEEGAEVVGIELDMLMDVTLDGESAKMTMDGDYTRKTTDDAIAHKAKLDITVEGEKLEILFKLNDRQDGKATGMLGAMIAGEEFVTTFDRTTEGEKITRTFGVYLRSGATAILEPAASARPIVSVNVVSEPAPAEVLSALENATPATSTNVLQMTTAQSDALMNAISTNGMQVYFKLLSELPSSVMMLMMGQ